MKLNNKGFAITGILYGLLILFALLVGSYLTVLTARKNRLDGIVENIEDEYNNTVKKLYTVSLYVDGDDKGSTTVSSGSKYEQFFMAQTSSLTCNCTNGQSCSISHSTGNDYIITINSVTANTTCNVDY